MEILQKSAQISKYDIKTCHNRLYRIWQKMKERCYNENHDHYHNYGGRGIYVCEEWMSEHGFGEFKEWALNNGYADNLSLDRKDNDGIYSPENCRWITHKEQCNNTSRNVSFSLDGKKYTLMELCEKYHMDYKLVHSRITKLNWPVDEALGLRRHERKKGWKVKNRKKFLR